MPGSMWNIASLIWQLVWPSRRTMAKGACVANDIYSLDVWWLWTVDDIQCVLWGHTVTLASFIPSKMHDSSDKNYYLFPLWMCLCVSVRAPMYMSSTGKKNMYRWCCFTFQNNQRKTDFRFRFAVFIYQIKFKKYFFTLRTQYSSVCFVKVNVISLRFVCVDGTMYGVWCNNAAMYLLDIFIYLLIICYLTYYLLLLSCERMCEAR